MSLIKIDTEGLELNILRNGQNFLAKHRFPPILFEAWNASYYEEHKNALIGFLRSLDYEIVQVGRMDYVAQHPFNDRYLELLEQKDNSVTYQMKRRAVHVSR